jgi:hypothetical protein
VITAPTPAEQALIDLLGSYAYTDAVDYFKAAATAGCTGSHAVTVLPPSPHRRDSGGTFVHREGVIDAKFDLLPPSMTRNMSREDVSEAVGKFLAEFLRDHCSQVQAALRGQDRGVHRTSLRVPKGLRYDTSTGVISFYIGDGVAPAVLKVDDLSGVDIEHVNTALKAHHDHLQNAYRLVGEVWIRKAATPTNPVRIRGEWADHSAQPDHHYNPATKEIEPTFCLVCMAPAGDPHDPDCFART